MEKKGINQKRFRKPPYSLAFRVLRVRDSPHSFLFFSLAVSKVLYFLFLSSRFIFTIRVYFLFLFQFFFFLFPPSRGHRHTFERSWSTRERWVSPFSIELTFEPWRMHVGLPETLFLFLCLFFLRLSLSHSDSFFEHIVHKDILFLGSVRENVDSNQDRIRIERPTDTSIDYKYIPIQPQKPHFSGPYSIHKYRHVAQIETKNEKKKETDATDISAVP